MGNFETPSGYAPGFNAPVPKLPPADPWDRQRGISTIETFEVSCSWVPVNEDWVEVHAQIVLWDGVYSLARPAQIRRVYRELRSGRQEMGAELLASAWTKKMLTSSGADLTGLYEQNPGHVSYEDGNIDFRWYASMGARLSLAVIRLDGNLQGIARVVPVS